jgi:nicotinate-nucleotide adenylyltransferase
MHIAVLGGTFNPIHFGHLRAAEEVAEGLALDKVIFMPSSTPPHKPPRAVPAAELRLEMIKIAIRSNPRFEVSDIEIRRGGRSYTFETVKELKAGKELKLSLIVGADSFNEITSWCEYEELLKTASFIVVPRPGYPVKKVAEVLPVELARKFWYDADTGAYVNSFGSSVTYFNTTPMDISSSGIREIIGRGLSPRYLLDDAVLGFILKEGLYKGAPV